MDTKAYVQQYKNELLTKLSELVSYPSVMGEPLPDAPFGAGPRDVLQAALKMMEEDGFKTVNLDNYIGYAEMGEGDRLIGVVGHLDVVPAVQAEGWNTDPFKMTIDGGKVYGRGVSDDKGAVVCSMIALKILRDMGTPLNKRIRLIMGTNEESGSKGLAYYVAKEGDVDLGFTPDGDFPGVYGEKGMVEGVYRCPKTGLLDIQGGTVTNVVCRTCMAKVAKNSFSMKKLEDYFNNNSIEFRIEEEPEAIVIHVTGVAAHASTPQLGVNAISHLLVGLQQAGLQDPFVNFYCSHIGLESDGGMMGCKCSDEYGALTLNAGIIHMKDGVIEGSIDIRFPVTMSSKQVLKLMSARMKDENGEFTINETEEPLFYPMDSPLVQALTSAYQEVTGDTKNQPMVIGGGTYAKGIRNIIAFGCAFPGVNNHIHDANEFCAIDELLLQVEIYVNALQKLLAI